MTAESEPLKRQRFAVGRFYDEDLPTKRGFEYTPGAISLPLIAVNRQIRDLSGAGISFYSPSDFEKGETLELEFAPRDSGNLRTFMNVVWRRVQGDGYLIGCRYVAEHPGDIEAVSDYVTKKK